MSIAEQMGVVAAEHRLFGEHQGAARFLLRGVRARRHAGRQRAAHAGASRLDGSLGRDHHPREQGHDPPGDVYAINAPYNGGTHLPDITVCTPVFDDKKKAHPVLGRLARPSRRCRRHFARLDVAERHHHRAGRRLFDNFKLVDRGRFREKELMAALTGAKYPARNPVQNVNDIKAQIAANEKGVAELRKMVTHFTHAGGEGLYAARAGQRRRKRAARDRPAARSANSPTRWIRAPSSR